MPAVNGGSPVRGRRSGDETASVLSAALKHAMSTSRASRPLVARLCGRSVKTIERWLSGAKPVEVHRVMTSRRLWRPFLKCMVAIDRKARWL